ncbi:MAG: hypothetical protein M3Q10_07760 [Chloroflexota bacterium]|nr:hypothetical protein [Chloroflexota bacterium]
MITSRDILDKTGIKSAKTLTRWHQRGLIPAPLVRTHPSGRGKVAFWPDWVLDRCVKIVELQRQGHSLQSAALVLDVERLTKERERVEADRPVSELLADTRVRLTPTRDGTVLDAFLLAMVASVEARLRDVTEQQRLLAELRDSDAVDRALNCLRAGYAPVLVYDGGRPEIIPDFLVSWRLGEDLPARSAFVVAPLLPTFREMFPWIERFVGTSPTASPAPKIWSREGDAVVEYTFYPAGPIGFELIRETAQVVSTVASEAGSDAHARQDAGNAEHD